MFRHYWYFLNKSFSYGPYTSTDFKNIAIIHVKIIPYRVYFKDISKHKAKKLMNNFDLVGKTGNIYCND